MGVGDPREAPDGLTVEGLTVAYGPIVAVRDVDLVVRPGEIVALLGPNGAGKSSTLNAIAGLVKPAGGRVAFGAERLERRAPEAIVACGVALVPEGRRVFARLSVEDNLRLGGTLQPGRAALAEALGRVHALFPVLRDRRHQHAGSLSGGQQQMLAIGRALMSSPRLLLLDEPSLGLAPIVVNEIFSLIERLRTEGTTVLLVEQNVHRALQISDRAYVLAHGEVQAQGDSRTMLAGSEIERTYLGIGAVA